MLPAQVKGSHLLECHFGLQSIEQGHLEILAEHEELRQKARERLADTTQEIEETSDRISQGHLDAIHEQLQIRRNFEKKFMEGLTQQRF